MKVDEQAMSFLQRLSDDLWGFGIDGVGAIDAWADGFPGFDGLELDDTEPVPRQRAHRAQGVGLRGRLHPPFPRRQRRPGPLDHPQADPGGDAGPGNGDDPDHASSTTGASTRGQRRCASACAARSCGCATWATPRARGRSRSRTCRTASCARVTGRHVVLACWNTMIPYICGSCRRGSARRSPSRPSSRLMYANVQIRDWKSFAKLKLAARRLPQHVLAERRSWTSR